MPEGHMAFVTCFQQDRLRNCLSLLVSVIYLINTVHDGFFVLLLVAASKTMPSPACASLTTTPPLSRQSAAPLWSLPSTM
eukprot:1157364-Pelagomonas_calceolata.AAC.3